VFFGEEKVFFREERLGGRREKGCIGGERRGSLSSVCKLFIYQEDWTTFLF
jgi:hypothetical protein